MWEPIEFHPLRPGILSRLATMDFYIRLVTYPTIEPNKEPNFVFCRPLMFIFFCDLQVTLKLKSFRALLGGKWHRLLPDMGN